MTYLYQAPLMVNIERFADPLSITIKGESKQKRPIIILKRKSYNKKGDFCIGIRSV